MSNNTPYATRILDKKMKHVYHGHKEYYMQLFYARELIIDYSYSWCGGTELISDTVTVVVVARN